MKCEDNRVMNDHDRTGKLVESSTHTVQEFGSPEHRDTASSNANKFNLAFDEENIDFNRRAERDGETITWHQRSQLDSADRESPQRKALQSDLQQHRAFNPFSKKSKDAITAAELCEIVDVGP